MRSEDGFTLVELIAIMIVLAVITTVVVVKFNVFTQSAKDQTITTSIAELNTREKHHWLNAKLEGVHEDIDTYVLTLVSRQIGGSATVSEDGTLITVGGISAPVVRTPATTTTPAIWSR